MSDSWIAAVDTYLDALDAAVENLRESLERFNTVTTSGQFGDLASPTETTAEAVRALEMLLDQRSELLRIAPGDTRPRSLRAALRRARQGDRLARCEQLARRIDVQRQNAVAQFVTQYQLADTESRLLRILTQRGPDPGTYGPQRPVRGGNLLDGAA